jgi:hypothetical protein
MKAQHSKIVVSSKQPDLSPYLITTTQKEDPKKTSLDSSDGAPTLSFGALSLQQPQPSQITAEDEFRRRYRPVSADFKIFSSPQSPTEMDVPTGLMVRTVSLEPKTLFTKIPAFASSFPEEQALQKRGRHLRCDSLPCNEIGRQTQKRRRLANKNRALTSSDFDSILSELGTMNGSL